MKYLILLATAAAVAIQPTPAAAQVSPYVEATSNYNGATAGYGLKAGLQLGNVTAELGAEDFASSSAQTTYVGALGLQPKIFGPFSAYAQVGYLNRGGDSGFRLGGGGVINFTNHVYGKVGYQRDDFGQGHADAVTAGLGVKF